MKIYNSIECKERPILLKLHFILFFSSFFFPSFSFLVPVLSIIISKEKQESWPFSIILLCGNLIHLRIKHKTWEGGCYIPAIKAKTRIWKGTTTMMDAWNLKAKILYSYASLFSFFFPFLYLKYGSVMTFNNDGFLETKFCHSILSIFPSWFTSASKKVCPQILWKKNILFHEI